MINQARPDILIIGLGAPKQEIWVHAMHSQLQVKVALCVGATIDFLAGEKMRAPKLMRTLGLEWLHRMLSEPKRLAGRYWHDAKIFPRLVFRELTSE
jgi:N-acetylglucosaminyldiphosphoundecaprenol N-acetyl-beta-D-mannosaminyltransferase